MAELGV